MRNEFITEEQRQYLIDLYAKADMEMDFYIDDLTKQDASERIKEMKELIEDMN